MAAGECDDRDRAVAALATTTYADLRRIAHRLMDGERRGHTLQATALVHEAFARLYSAREQQFESPAHYVRLAVRSMRRTLIDYARRTHSARRDYALRVALLDHDGAGDGEVSLLELCEVIEQLDQVHPKLALVFELRAVGGLTIEECTKEIGVSEGTISARWRASRAWVAARLQRSSS